MPVYSSGLAGPGLRSVPAHVVAVAVDGVGVPLAHVPMLGGRVEDLALLLLVKGT